MGSIHLCGVEDQNLKKQVSLIFVIEPASSHNLCAAAHKLWQMMIHRNARCGAQEINMLAFWVQAGFGRKMRPCAKPSTPNRANTCVKCWWRCAKRPASRSANWRRNSDENITWLDDWSWVSAAWM